MIVIKKEYSSKIAKVIKLNTVQSLLRKMLTIAARAELLTI